MPPLLDYGHLFQYLTSLGFVSTTGMGRAPISYTEIQSWANLLQVDLSIFEVECLRELSSAYMIEVSDATDDKNRPPPYVPDEPTPAQRAKVDSFFRSFAANHNRNRNRRKAK